MDRLRQAAQKARTELKELDRQARELDSRRELLRFHIAKLDEELGEEAEWAKPKRPGDDLSLPVLTQSILENHPDGLRIPMILEELEKLGFQTQSKNPTATLNTVLYRHRPKKFMRLTDGRWFLTKYANRHNNVVPIAKVQS